MNNPMNMVKGIANKGATPQEFLMKTIMGNNSNPMINRLINMAQNGNSKEIETFARNIMKEKGRDFDKEFSEFMNNMKR